MDQPAVQLLCLKQKDRPLEDHTRDLFDLSCLTHLLFFNHTCLSEWFKACLSLRIFLRSSGYGLTKEWSPLIHCMERTPEPTIDKELKSARWVDSANHQHGAQVPQWVWPGLRAGNTVHRYGTAHGVGRHGGKLHPHSCCCECTAAGLCITFWGFGRGYFPDSTVPAGPTKLLVFFVSACSAQLEVSSVSREPTSYSKASQFISPTSAGSR